MGDVSQTGKKRKVGDGTPGPGRPKGVPNKVTQDVREMVLNALRNVGGEAYLQAQAEANPGAFMSLVGKTLPKDIKLGGDLALKVSLVPRKPDAA
jgi:hypothetical protein